MFETYVRQSLEISTKQKQSLSMRQHLIFDVSKRIFPNNVLILLESFVLAKVTSLDRSVKQVAWVFKGYIKYVLFAH